jgi:hypothetical protein
MVHHWKGNVKQGDVCFKGAFKEKKGKASEWQGKAESAFA